MGTANTRGLDERVEPDGRDTSSVDEYNRRNVLFGLGICWTLRFVGDRLARTYGNKTRVGRSCRSSTESVRGTGISISRCEFQAPEPAAISYRFSRLRTASQGGTEAATGLVRVPRPVTETETVSPGLSQGGGDCPAATPAVQAHWISQLSERVDESTSLTRCSRSDDISRLKPTSRQRKIQDTTAARGWGN